MTCNFSNLDKVLKSGSPNDWVVKPFKPQSLIDVLKEVVL